MTRIVTRLGDALLARCVPRLTVHAQALPAGCTERKCGTTGCTRLCCPGTGCGRCNC